MPDSQPILRTQPGVKIGPEYWFTCDLTAVAQFGSVSVRSWQEKCNGFTLTTVPILYWNRSGIRWTDIQSSSGVMLPFLWILTKDFRSMTLPYTIHICKIELCNQIETLRIALNYLNNLLGMSYLNAPISLSRLKVMLLGTNTRNLRI